MNPSPFQGFLNNYHDGEMMTHVDQAIAAFHLMTKPRGAICNLDCQYCYFLSKERHAVSSSGEMLEWPVGVCHHHCSKASRKGFGFKRETLWWPAVGYAPEVNLVGLSPGTDSSLGRSERVSTAIHLAFSRRASLSAIVNCSNRSLLLLWNGSP